jgi:hypothetical protein
MLKQMRMRKAVMMAEKLKEAVLPNNISISEIISEQKKNRRFEIKKPQ